MVDLYHLLERWNFLSLFLDHSEDPHDYYPITWHCCIHYIIQEYPIYEPRHLPSSQALWPILYSEHLEVHEFALLHIKLDVFTSALLAFLYCNKALIGLLRHNHFMPAILTNEDRD
ncbi:115aa long hypothetical protein [Pyrococcus horikoshii OT3]|uniref:Uncharacterized protein n=1 Tax=Pyrococcus horikoshii (strain ATCC 700860 / DSM 12428 / JCM 9974 / NBRC 100139 / OT-3) TaxID=70601 RepID=O58343_PYRHO|nr:115aa long hypothetical protein [Pyrococcus horikoshii OT3]